MVLMSAMCPDRLQLEALQIDLNLHVQIFLNEILQGFLLTPSLPN